MKWKSARKIDTCFPKAFCCLPLRAGVILIGILGVLAGIAVIWINPWHWYHILSGILFIVCYLSAVIAGITEHERVVYVHIYMAGLLAGAICISIIVITTISVIFGLSVVMHPFNYDCVDDWQEKEEGTGRWEGNWNETGSTPAPNRCDSIKWIVLRDILLVHFGVLFICIYTWLCGYSYFQLVVAFKYDRYDQYDFPIGINSDRAF
jgi:hypothetical protein